MLLPLLFILPIAEIYLFFYAAQEVGWPAVVLWTVVSFILGKRMLGMQTSTMAQDPLGKIHLLLGSFLLMLPGFITDIIGLLLILPGTSHLLSLIFKSRIEKMMKSGQFKTFTAGGFPGGFTGGFSTGFPGAASGNTYTSERTGASDDNMVIDADYKDVTNEKGTDTLESAKRYGHTSEN